MLSTFKHGKHAAWRGRCAAAVINIRDLHTIRYLIPCQSLGTNGEIKYKTVMLGPVRDAKFTWDQSDWLGKLQKWDFEQANQLRIF